MVDIVRFDTPENISIAYRLAGPGTRFVAFFVDSLLILFSFVILGLLAMAVVVLLQGEFGFSLGIGPVIFGLVFGVALGFAWIGYFAAFEWFLEGRTPGKRATALRVVTQQGFSLSFAAVFIRNIFRVIDIVPLLWIVPVVAQYKQRFGDMVAGTIVVSEEPLYSQAVRDQLLARDAGQMRYTFDRLQLGKLTDTDWRALELFLERREQLHPDHRKSLALRLARSLTARFSLPPPESEEDNEHFVEDLLASHLRRQAQELG
ncbi:MAG: RDD family protein [Candidatus Hydrogenedentes bacterium]|nr:RDD family protein [Candidatus Hydrogenedentota bacterium]